MAGLGQNAEENSKWTKLINYVATSTRLINIPSIAAEHASSLRPDMHRLRSLILRDALLGVFFDMNTW